MNKKALSQLVSVTLLIIFAIAIALLVFRWIGGTVAEEGQKGADRALAEDICREQVSMRVNSIQDDGDFYIINVENRKERILSDFLVRYELVQEVEIKRARQIISAFETANIKVEKPSFTPNLIKVIPQITLEDPEITANDRAWWLCSNQLSEYEL